MKRFRFPFRIVRREPEKAPEKASAITLLRDEITVLRRQVDAFRSGGVGGGVGSTDDAFWNRLVLEDRLDDQGTMFGLRGANPLTVVIESKDKKGEPNRTWSIRESKNVKETTPTRMDGNTRYYRRDVGDGDRIAARAAAEWWVRHDPIVRNGIGMLRYYTLGNGAKISSPAEPISQYLYGAWRHNRNRMERVQKRHFHRFLVDGELFPLVHKPKAKGEPVLFRTVHPDDVTEIFANLDDLDMGQFIEVTRLVQKFKEDKKYYRLIGGDPEATMNRELLHPEFDGAPTIEEDRRAGFYTLGYDGESLSRGLPSIFSVMKWNRLRRDYLMARMIRNREAARIILIHSQTEVGDYEAARSTQTTEAPPGGVQLNAAPGETYTYVSPDVKGGESRPDYETLLNEIAAGMGVPPHILALDSSSTNYSSIRIADTPFAQHVIDLQDEYREIVLDQLKVAIEWAVELKELPKSMEVAEETPELIAELDTIVYRALKRGEAQDLIAHRLSEAVDKAVARGAKTKIIPTTEVPLSVSYPLVINPDPEKITNRVKILRDLGMISVRTGLEMVGIDTDRELTRLADERAEDEERQKKALADYQRTGKLPVDDEGGDDEDDEE